MEAPERLVEKANKKLNPGFFAKFTSNEEDRKNEAAELFQQAAASYKLKKNWMQAGNCYEKAGELEDETGGTAAYTNYQEAAHCYGFVDQNKKKGSINKCIKSCEKVGKFMQAGKLLQQIGVEYEENTDYDNAIESYKKANEYFKSESQNTKSSQQSCMTKIADLMCISGHKDMLTEAPKIYEKLGMQYLTNPLLKTQAKDHFFKCVVVILASGDELAAGQALDRFLIEDPTFDETRESKFLKEAIRCVGQPCDPEGFKKAVADLKKVRDLDRWKLGMFAAILKKMEKDDDDMK